MRELATDALSTLLYTLAAGLLTIGGSLAEYTSLQYVTAGDTIVAFWLAAIGAVMLYAGLYGIGYQKVLTRLVQIETRT